MTAPPLPESPTMRVRLDYTQVDGYLAGSRFYLGYAGSPPTPGNCTTLATDIAAAWNTHLGAVVSLYWALTEVDVLDITTNSGASGQADVDYDGSDSGDSLPSQCAMNVEFDIARRYRGGKPRMFLPGGQVGNTLDGGHWSDSWVSTVTAAVAAFFAEIEALSIGAVGALNHQNLSYYEGFTNVTNSSGRTRAAPKYRATALVDNIEGYAAKALMGSQKRRRNATTA